jgi:periplasmic protein TonB
MRWFMLPVSAAAHVAAFLVTLIVPLATGVEAPTPWPTSRVPEFVAAAPVPPPPVLRAVSAGANRNVAPTEAPDHIEPPLLAETTPGPVFDGVGDDIGVPHGVIGGVPEGLTSPALLPSPPPAPAPPAAYRPGGMIREPRKLVDVAPIYPDIARAAKVEGLVILEATIDERGVVTDARVLRSVPLLDAAALAALKQWRYSPTLLNGIPVRVLMTVTFRFSLAARDETPAAFGRRCIPGGCARRRTPAMQAGFGEVSPEPWRRRIAPPSNTPGILSRRALPTGRLAGLGATLAFHHGLLGDREL